MCEEWEFEKETLEQRGWHQEHYRAQEARFSGWNWGVWNHAWKLVSDRCLLCLSEGPCIQADNQSLCLMCLNEFPNTSWHPTGSIRPKTSDLMAHGQRCSTSHW